MRKLSQKQLTDHVNLVKWQEHKRLQKFNLLTIHSLLLNGNPKFIELKSKIQSFNSMLSKGIQRKHLQFEYTKKLYQMLRYMVNIKNYQAQQQFLQKVYSWSKGGKMDWDFEGNDGATSSKSRPTTATTRTRPFSAYSRPNSGYNRIAMLKLQQPATKIKQQKKTNPTIDYEKLKPGDVEFFTGQRTLHQQEQKPKNKLKQYQRKVFYDQEQDSDLEIIELKEQKPPIFSFKHIDIKNQPQQQALPQGQNIGDGTQIKLQGQQNQIGQQQQAQQGQQDINVDDLPIDGQAQQDEPQQVIDKLKPRLKAFIKHDNQLSKNQIKYVKGINHYIQERNELIRKTAEDDIIKMKMLQWARDKSRTKRQQKRRAQSARIVTKKIGIGYREPLKQQEQNVNVINLQDFPIAQTKNPRPKTAFKAFNQNNRKQLIKNCFITGAMQGHIQKFEITVGLTAQRDQKIVSLAQKPKKKTFQQILRQAEQKVKLQQDEQIINVKQKFARSKVPFETNRIAKSVTYHAGGFDEDEYEEQEQAFGGGIIGMNMLSNPFFKVGKKKKKKKKKK